MWTTIKTILGYIIDYIKNVVGGVVIDEKIAADTKAIDDRTADSKAELARLNQLGVLQTTASNEAQVLTDKVAADEAQVAAKTADVTKAVQKQRAIKKPTEDVSAADLESKLEGLE